MLRSADDQVHSGIEPDVTHRGERRNVRQPLISPIADEVVNSPSKCFHAVDADCPRPQIRQAQSVGPARRVADGGAQLNARRLRLEVQLIPITPEEEGDVGVRLALILLKPSQPCLKRSTLGSSALPIREGRRHARGAREEGYRRNSRSAEPD